MINYWTELHGEIKCDKCGMVTNLFASKEMGREIDADIEIEDEASRIGWEVDGDKATCDECLNPDGE